VGKQRVDASLRFRWIENEFSLAVFLLHGVVAVHGNLPEGLGAITEHDRVDGISEQCNADCGRNADHEQPA